MTIAKLLILCRTLVDPVLRVPGSGNFRCEGTSPQFCIRFTPVAGDTPKLIGRDGANVANLRHLVETLGRHHGLQVRFVIVDPEPTTRKALNKPIPFSPLWKPSAVVEAVGDYFRSWNQPDGVWPTHEGDSFRIVHAGSLQPSVHRALVRWVSVMSLSSGGKAFIPRMDESLTV